MQIKIVIADDDALIRESLEILLKNDKEFQVVKIAENGLEAVNACILLKADVALLDIRMPGLSGVEAIKRIKEKCNTRVILLTTFSEDQNIQKAFEYGAKGYLLKGCSSNQIKNAIKVVYNGGTVFEDSILEKYQQGKLSFSSFDKSGLTEREFQVVEKIACGLTNKEISEKLYLSEGTIKNYITSILGKLGLKQRTQIAIYYLKGGKI